MNQTYKNKNNNIYGSSIRLTDYIGVYISRGSVHMVTIWADIIRLNVKYSTAEGSGVNAEAVLTQGTDKGGRTEPPVWRTGLKGCIFESHDHTL